MSESLIQALNCPIHEITLIQFLIAEPKELALPPACDLKSEMFSSKFCVSVFDSLVTLVKENAATSPISVLAGIDMDFGDLIKRQNEIVELLTLPKTSVVERDELKHLAFKVIDRFEQGELVNKMTGAIKDGYNFARFAEKEWGVLALKNEMRKDEKAYQPMRSHLDNMKAGDLMVSLPETITSSRIITETAGGLVRGMPTVISGRSGNGKSVIAFNAAIDCAKDGKKVLYVSTEVDLRTMMCQFLSHISDTPLSHFGNGKASEKGKREHIYASFEACEWADNLQFSCQRAPYVEDVISKIKGNQAYNLNHRAYDVIIVDFIQHLRQPKNSKESRTEYIANNAEALMTLASKQDSALLLVSQSNREADERWDVPSKASEISGSDFLYQAAFGVLFVKKESEKSALPENSLPVIRKEGGDEEHMFKIAVYGSKSKNGKPVTRCIDINGKTKKPGPIMGMSVGE